jgi:hypothetical protein
MSRILAFLVLALAAQEKPAPRTPAWVDSRIAEIQPSGDERKFDTIAWVSSIKEALRLAKLHSRPLMMFTYDGQIQTGRC